MGIKQDVEALFFGSGVQELYEHWQSEMRDDGSLFRRHGEWETGQAPDIWAYKVTAANPLDSERLLRKVITYSVIYTAAELIEDGKADTGKPFYPVSAETGRACANLVHCDDVSMFDLHTVDEVLQVAVYGGVWYPHFEPRRKNRD